MGNVGTVIVWHLMLTAVSAAALAGLVLVQCAAARARQLIRPATETWQEQGQVEPRLRDVAQRTRGGEGVRRFE